MVLTVLSCFDGAASVWNGVRRIFWEGCLSGGHCYLRQLYIQPCLCRLNTFRCTVNQTCQCFVWKNNFSAPGGRKVAIFGMEDLDPLYFDVSNVSAPPDPPICLKTPKCAIFCTFRESHLEHTPKVGVRPEKFNIGNVAQNFLVASTYVGTMPFHFRNISPWKNFHRHRQRHLHQSPTNFLNFGY